MPPQFIIMSKVGLCTCDKDLVVGDFMHTTYSTAAIQPPVSAKAKAKGADDDIKSLSEEAASDPASDDAMGALPDAVVV